MLLNSFLHQRGDDCTSQSGKTEKGGRYGFIIKFAFPPSFVHLIKRRSEKKKERKKSTHRAQFLSPRRKEKLSCLSFAATSMQPHGYHRRGDPFRSTNKAKDTAVCLDTGWMCWHAAAVPACSGLGITHLQGDSLHQGTARNTLSINANKCTATFSIMTLHTESSFSVEK